MKRWLPGFRGSDLVVLAAMLGVLALLAMNRPDQVWRDAATPAALIVAYAIWSWRRR